MSGDLIDQYLLWHKLDERNRLWDSEFSGPSDRVVGLVAIDLYASTSCEEDERQEENTNHTTYNTPSKEKEKKSLFTSLNEEQKSGIIPLIPILPATFERCCSFFLLRLRVPVHIHVLGRKLIW